MLPILLGLIFFVAIHLVPTRPELRDGLVRRAGEGAYKMMFSVIAIAGLILIVAGYHKIQLNPSKSPVLWTPPDWGRHVTLTLMLPVFPLLVATYLPGKISGVIRHPMITAVKFWALAHLFVRGDLASLLLFVGFLGWAVYDRISLKKREAAGLVTVKSGPVVNDIIALVVGLGLYAVFVRWGHAALIGLPILP